MRQEVLLLEGSNPCSQHGLSGIPELQPCQPGPQFPVSPSSQRVVFWGLVFSCRTGSAGCEPFLVGFVHWKVHSEHEAIPVELQEQIPPQLFWEQPPDVFQVRVLAPPCLALGAVLSHGAGKGPFESMAGAVPMGMPWH